MQTWTKHSSQPTIVDCKPWCDDKCPCSISPVSEDSRIRSNFLSCDKDTSEIKAIQKTFPLAKIQLCYWHALRAMRKKLKENGHTESLNRFHADQAARVVPGLEIC